ncbi:hypothetical protein BO86DRAFT_229115 [Aspergillus japonicus CBS 114.51]|uniref:Uncharacterized protein n=2 Tax=Aspergillus TaxID=5052 RepID=A0A2V5HBH0_ASPV1|nr:hypothetical protein BO86DRAFT_229115 [Aspergillus japonicus CBS 114.51]PYI21718.1 hypothetical protein BO99DRAFT_61468 [Aspergillus violaceofuscus CBS 115571]RAH84720.1 hypothetical protein BO86DRAFT_229115 [Aspergillus japonicus CBS 114.51]
MISEVQQSPGARPQPRPQGLQVVVTVHPYSYVRCMCWLYSSLSPVLRPPVRNPPESSADRHDHRLDRVCGEKSVIGAIFCEEESLFTYTLQSHPAPLGNHAPPRMIS